MKQNKRNVARKLAIHFFIFSLLLSTVGIGTVVASSSTVSIDPASQSVSAGDTFTVDVAVDPAGYGVSSGEINIAFDATVMQADSIESGDLLGVSPLVGVKEIDNVAGTIKYALARVGTTTLPTPPGAFATATFTVKSDAPIGTYDIDITTVGLADESFEDIPGITINDGVVKVIMLEGDINGDCVVDYKDLGILGATYGKSAGDADYDSRADINDDDTVDYKDLGILGAHYGESCTA